MASEIKLCACCGGQGQIPTFQRREPGTKSSFTVTLCPQCLGEGVEPISTKDTTNGE